MNASSAINTLSVVAVGMFVALSLLGLCCLASVLLYVLTRTLRRRLKAAPPSPAKRRSAMILTEPQRTFATGVRAPRKVDRKRRLPFVTPPQQPRITIRDCERPSVWSKCHPDVLACLVRVFESDLTFGMKTLQSCRLVNRHWYQELTLSIKKLTPHLGYFTFWDLCALKKFPSVKQLTLRDHNVVTDSWLLELPEVVPQLESLSIRFVAYPASRTTFSQQGTQALLRFKYLKHLEVAASEFNSLDCLQTVARMRDLTHLDLSENKLSHRGILPLTSLVNLEELVLGGNDKLGNDTVCLIALFVGLKHLSLRSCRLVTDKGLITLSELKSLTSLDLRKCDGINGHSFLHCSQWPLTKLNLMGCSELQDMGLSYLSNLKFLKFLDLRLCPKITDVGIGYLKQLPSLLDLRIGAGTTGITDAGLAVLPELPCLEFLTLFFMNTITYKGLERVYTMETLNKLTIIQCQRIARVSLRRSDHLKVELYPCAHQPPAGAQT